MGSDVSRAVSVAPQTEEALSGSTRDIPPTNRKAEAVRNWKSTLGVGAMLLVGTELLLFLASFARPPLTFDVGPSTGRYAVGFTQSMEYAPTTARFGGRTAWIALPLHASGGTATVTVRCSRLAKGAAHVRLAARGGSGVDFLVEPASETLSDWFDRGQPSSGPFRDFRVVRLSLDLPSGAPRLELRVNDAVSPSSRFELAVDWIRIEGVRFWLWPRLAGPRLLIMGAFLLCVTVGLSVSVAGFASGVLALLVCGWASIDPFACAYVCEQAWAPALVLSALTFLFLRKQPRAGMAMLVFLAGFLLKATGVLHPNYYYPDVLSHSRTLAAVRSSRGDLLERQGAWRTRASTGQRAFAGEVRTLPYSSVYYVPFMLLPDEREIVEDVMKQVALAEAALEAVVVFVLAGFLLSERGALLAMTLAASLPPLLSRLSLATWPAIQGHFLDTTAVAATGWLMLRPEERKRFAVWFVVVLVGMASYVSSVFTLGAFLVSLAVFEARLRWRLLVFGGLALALASALVYLPSSPDLLASILPSVIAKGGLSGESFVLRSLVTEVRRIPIFYGFAYPLLAAAGLAAVLRRSSPDVGRRLYAAYAVAAVGLMLLRGLATSILRDLREIEFAAPLIAVLAAGVLDDLARRGPLLRWSVRLIVAGLVLFGLVMFARYYVPVTRLAELR